MTRRTRGASFVRFGVVAVLAFILSGAGAVGSAATGEPNACGQQRGTCDFGSPPACADGCCARVLPAVLGDVPESIAAPTRERWLRDELGPPAPPPLDGVFHPPIR